MSTAPTFSSIPNKGTPGALTAANAAVDGTGATGRLLAFTAAAGGSFLPSIRYVHKGTNVGTVMRVFRNNGSDPEVASNNTLIAERTINANTLSQTAESIKYENVLNLALANGERIYVTMGTAVAAGIHVSPINGGDL